jgi:hypothetical protein
VGEGENVTGALERLLFLLSRGFVSVSVCSFEQKNAYLFFITKLSTLKTSTKVPL